MLGEGGQPSYQRATSAFNIRRFTALSPIRSISSGFNCHYESEREIDIQEGDIVGACIYDPDDGFFIDYSQLDVVGNANGFSLLEMSDVSDCGFGEMPSSVVEADLSVATSRILHLSAEIGINCSSL